MELAQIHRIYFIGIGGIGMSALARYFNEKGKQVFGYDRNATSLTNALEQEGISITYEESIAAVDEQVDLVVYTPAISNDNQILSGYRAVGIEPIKRSDLLEIVTKELRTIAVAGTHGKTTTSSMIAFLLQESGIECNAFLGGIAVNYNSNYWSGNSDIAVVEADEYDRSFLKLSPDVAVLTAMDADHLDVYGTKEECEAAFVAFTNRIKETGTLIYKQGLGRVSEMGANDKVSYSLQNNAAAAYVKNIMMKNGGYYFDVMGPEWMIPKVYLPIGGMHNVENCVAAITVAKEMGVEDFDIKNALAKFKGIKRRFEYVVKTDDVVYIDDYAHHPEELQTLIKSAQTLFSKKKCVIAFQPHLYSRTRDFSAAFAEALNMADEIILLDIYPAREAPIEGVTSEIIKEKIGNPNVTIMNRDGIVDYVKYAPIELFITAGAGDIDQLVNPIKEVLEDRYSISK